MIGTIMSFCVLTGIVLSNEWNKEVDATTYSSTSFQPGEHILLGKEGFTVLESSSGLKLLADSASLDDQTWNDAVNSLGSYSSGFGTLGTAFVNGNVTLPTTSDLANLTTGTTLNSQIPSISSDWWLGDASINNRSKFVSANNQLDTEVTIPKTIIANAACDVEDAVENGVKITSDGQDESVTQVMRTGEQSFSGNVIINSSGTTNVKRWRNANCSGNPVGTDVYTDGTAAAFTDARGNYTTGKFTRLPNQFSALFMVYGFMNLDYRPASINDILSFNLEANQCYSMKVSTYDYTIMADQDATVNIKLSSITGNNSGITCDGQTHSAGRSSVRPMITLPSSSIAFANTSKRQFTSSPFSEEFPTSDSGNSKPYLTLLEPKLTVGLDSSAKGVNGDTYSVALSDDNTVALPLIFSGDREGKAYVSASAQINGYTKYGVLKEITGTSDKVTVDLSKIADDPSSISSIALTLYHENEGQYETAYMGEGKVITIEILEKQKIAFDEGQATSLTYGSSIDLTSKLTSDPMKQASKDIKYTVKSGDVRIDSQSYDLSKGTATAKITALKGEGTAVIAINKAGDQDIEPADEVTYTIDLAKVPITIQPSAPNHILALNDTLPALLSTCSGLILNDTLPTTLLPVYEPIGSASASPGQNGTAQEVGQWKLVYPSNIQDLLALEIDFKSKYDVTFKDYHQDANFILEVGYDKIPDGWVEISPDANDDGWNHSDVTIQPSTAANLEGYTNIELLDQNGTLLKSGSSIIINSETSSLIAYVRLKKGTFTTSSSPIRELKLDKTKPTFTQSIDHETDWTTEKTVTISASDLMSGIKSVDVMRDGTTAYTPVLKNGAYVFEADENGSYEISVADVAGNITKKTITINKIDHSNISLTAIPETLTSDQPKQKITLTFDAGQSGVKSFKIYHAQAGGTPVFLQDLDVTKGSPIDWYAEMNGTFRFELINQTGSSITKDVVITQVNPPKPVTHIDATLKNDAAKKYSDGTWINQDVDLTISNVNQEVVGTITWQYSEDRINWKDLDASLTLPITTPDDTSIIKQVYFQGKVDKGGPGDVFEETPKKFTVKIDKTKPNTPTIKNDANYTIDKWYQKDVFVEAEVSDKATGVPQEIYACVETKAVCESSSAAWTKTNQGGITISAQGKHEVYFKAIDEAGNEGELSQCAYVNINGDAPVITISIEKNPIKSLISNLTFGFFYKESVDIDVDVNFGDGQSGTTYFIIDSAGGSTPLESDPRWKEYKGTQSLVPDAKAMVYVKAVSDAGVTSTEDSVYNIYADQTPPIITLPSNMSTWTNDPSIPVTIKDALSGVDKNTLRYHDASGNDTIFQITGDSGTINLTNDGIYDVVVKAMDHSGNNAQERVTVMIDTLAPTAQDFIPDQLGWAKDKIISFTASDALSKVHSVSVKDINGKDVPVILQQDGSYTFTVSANGDYEIEVSDEAGNIGSATYTESYIDEMAPVIENIVIANEQDWKSSKLVSFDATDAESDIDHIEVTYEENGATKQISVNPPTSNDTYTFVATKSTEYTITAYDRSGNSTTQKVTVDNIDPNGLKILNISDLTVWSKDEKTVTFEIQTGLSGLKTDYPKVMYLGSQISVNEIKGVYSFIASDLGSYEIIAQNNADETENVIVHVQKIDYLPPVIDQVSDNITSLDWRKPQTITFHINDWNSTDQSSVGSGIASGYPKAYIVLKGKRIDIPISHDPQDPSKFSFLAEYNGDYIIECMDIVGHAVVTETISVDHILEDNMISPIQVTATAAQVGITSGTWSKDTIHFEISGGLDSSILQQYQVAVTDGRDPQDSEWSALNLNDHAHEVTKDEKGASYFFRALPVIDGASISKPFVVNLDKTSPDQPNIAMKEINTHSFAKAIHMLSGGLWMKEAQELEFTASDNFTEPGDMRYICAEEQGSIIGDWKPCNSSLQYTDTNIILHVKAVDLAGNQSKESLQDLQIDSVPPIIDGVIDGKKYLIYQASRTVSVSDKVSQIAESYYTFNHGAKVDIQGQVTLTKAGVYEIVAIDYAGNQTTLTITLEDLPDISTQIDGSDESKVIIDQVYDQMNQNQQYLDQDEQTDIEQWIKDAEVAWLTKRNTALETNDKTSKVEGKDGTTFDPNTELVVENVSDLTTLPDLPRDVLSAYHVYLMKNLMKIQPDGSIKVYLPYNEADPPIVYEIDEQGNVKELSCKKEGNFVTFVTNKLMRYAISNTAQGIKKPTCATDGIDINNDSDGDGKPDVNIDLDGDCKADINLDMDKDHIPDLDIDTTGDGKADYNVDSDHDGKADLNIGPLPKPWKPDICPVITNVIYCTMTNLKPEVNIDTNHDGIPDLNVDTDGDGKPDINIDTNHDGKPDVNIDTDQDGLPDASLDTDQDGNIDSDINQDKEAENRETGDVSQTSVKSSYQKNEQGVGGATTSDDSNIMAYLMFMLLSFVGIVAISKQYKSN